MKFLVIAYPPTIFNDNKYYSYSPYVNEMNLWFKNIDKIGILSTTEYSKPLLLAPFQKKDFKIYKIQDFSTIGFFNVFKTVIKLPAILYKVLIACVWADHIHLRCPGNIGLVGSFIQILFPSKSKTVKYAGNWDPKSKQPWSYRLQKWILSNTFLTKNAKVLVYGNWPNQSKNIVPFFTATYSVKDIIQTEIKELSNELRFIYVGALHSGKQPLLSVKVIQKLKSSGYNVKLNMFGDGEEKENLNLYIDKHGLREDVIIHGNKSKDIVKQAYIDSHFLLFISKSEGWPKVVAEAMFWGCVPITSKVSCIPWMLENGGRGVLVENNVKSIVCEIEKILQTKEKYQSMSLNAQKWSQNYTLEKFDTEIQKVLKN